MLPRIWSELGNEQFSLTVLEFNTYMHYQIPYIKIANLSRYTLTWKKQHDSKFPRKIFEVPYLHIQHCSGITNFPSISNSKSIIASFQFKLFKSKLYDLLKLNNLVISKHTHMLSNLLHS